MSLESVTISERRHHHPQVTIPDELSGFEENQRTHPLTPEEIYSGSGPYRQPLSQFWQASGWLHWEATEVRCRWRKSDSSHPPRSWPLSSPSPKHCLLCSTSLGYPSFSMTRRETSMSVCVWDLFVLKPSPIFDCYPSNPRCCHNIPRKVGMTLQRRLDII